MTDLTKIYPFGKIEEKQNKAEHVLSFPYKGKWFTLNKNELSPTEILLLTTLFFKFEEQKQHLWYTILFEKKESIPKEGNYRILQLFFSRLPAYSTEKWQHTLNDVLQAEDLFFLNENEMIIVLKQTKHSLSLKELHALFASLDADFSSDTYVYVGHLLSFKEDWNQCFKEEQLIFRTVRSLNDVSHFLTLSTSALPYLTAETLHQSVLFQYLKKHLVNDLQLIQIIQRLIYNKGNLSSTAKDLFMHRNTLQYRLDKVYEQTGFNLRNMYDLILCDLIIHTT